MKNVTLTVSPNPIYPVPPPMPAAPYPPTTPFSPSSRVYSISFSAQFDDEANAMSFASRLLAMVNGDSE
jgi:hypothetical protein